MPQADAFLVSHLPQQAQPVMSVAAQMTAAHIVRCLMSFMLAETIASGLELSIIV